MKIPEYFDPITHLLLPKEYFKFSNRQKESFWFGCAWGFVMVVGCVAIALIIAG